MSEIYGTASCDDLKRPDHLMFAAAVPSQLTKQPYSGVLTQVRP